MKKVECEFEAEALSAALQSRWPDRVDAELRTHISSCPICSDVVTLAALFEESREDSRAAAELPDAGYVWRLAQARARRDAALMAMAPISVTQTIAFACAFGIAGACFGASSSWFQALLARIVSSLSGDELRLWLALAAQHSILIVSALALVFVVPTAVWLTVSDD